MGLNILLTKLHTPLLRSKLIKRKVLIQKLTDGMDKNSRLSLISAPAGYGKTTLAVEWINSLGCQYSWVSLDEGDNDHVRFLLLAAEALKKSNVMIGSDTEKLLQDPQMAGYKALLTMLLNDISLADSKVILVLDDYHLISSDIIHETLRFLIDHQPPNFHIVLTTREDPPLSLPRLRVREQLTEIRADDLRFCREEAQKFFGDIMDIKLAEDAVETITARTEGWVAGLQLAGLSLKHFKEEDIGNFIEEFNGTHRYVIDYLVEEVLSRQSDDMRNFLCKTSILERMNPEICDCITGRSDSRGILHELEQANLFIIPLDEKREWYRYHQLFADSLGTELKKEEKQQLFRNAAVWLEHNGYKQEAVKYAFKSGDMFLTVELIEKNVEDIFKNAQLSTLVKWLDALPQDIVKNSEILSVRKGWALYISGDIKKAMDYTNSLDEDFMARTTPHNRGLVLSLQALFTQYTGNGDTERLASEALNLLEDWDPIARIATMNTLGGAQSDLGRTKEANQTYAVAYNEGQKLGYTFITTLSLLYYGTNLNILGRRQEAIDLYETYIRGMKYSFGKPLPLAGIIYVSLAGMYYEGNDLEKAQDYVVKGMEMCRGMSINWTLNSEAWLAKILFAKGDRQDAMDTINEACRVSSEEKLPRKHLRNSETLVELLLREGNIDKAAEVAREWKVWLENTPSPLYEQIFIAYIKVLIAQKQINKALEFLGEVERPVKEGQRLKLLISVNILYCEAYCKRCEKNEAYRFLEDALKLAEGGCYIRTFLDEEENLAGILSEMKGAAGEFGQKLLKLMKERAEDNAVNSEPSSIQYEKSYKTSQELVEKLSQRELELLSLIAGGLTNSEISKKLFITINTTQWHISNIYSKLGVKNRTQAIIKAKELKLI